VHRRRGHRGTSALVGVAALVLGACGDTPSPGIEPGGGDEVAVAPSCTDVPQLEAQAPESEGPTGTAAAVVDDGNLPVPADTPTPPDAHPVDLEPPPEPLPDEGRPDDRELPEPDRGLDHDRGPAPTEESPGEEERSLGAELQRWGEREAADGFAGVWVDQDVGGYAVAFSEDVEAYAEEVRDRFHPGIAVAEAATTYAELRETQARLDEEMAAGAERWDEAPEALEAGHEGRTAAGPEPGDLMWSGVQVMINRVTVGLYEPDEQRLAELSERYGAELICFEIQRAPAEEDAEAAPFVPADDADLSPESTSIDLLVNERGCASGESAEDRMAPPQIEYGEDEVVVTTRVVPPPGPQTCPSNPDTPLTVELEEPLGDRELLDGSRQPAAEPERDW
jgi:hypothetical protein